MTQYYKDPLSTYTITEHRDGTATLKCTLLSGQRWHNQTYKNTKTAKAALLRFTGGRPYQVNKI